MCLVPSSSKGMSIAKQNLHYHLQYKVSQFPTWCENVAFFTINWELLQIGGAGGPSMVGGAVNTAEVLCFKTGAVVSESVLQ